MQSRIWQKTVMTVSVTINAILPRRIIEYLVTFFGMWALVTPLALWIASQHLPPDAIADRREPGSEVAQIPDADVRALNGLVLTGSPSRSTWDGY